MNLYDQLTALQIIPDAYEKWATYRAAVTEYIIEQAFGNREIALFGAGRCNDMDLRLLCSYFEKVILFDQDKTAMEQALLQYGLKEHPRIDMKVVSFTGIEEDDLRDYADALVKEVRRRGKETEIAELIDVASYQLNELEEKIKAHQFNLGQYENTVILGVHSQLINMLEWIWSVILQTIEKEEDAVRHRIMQLNDLVVERLDHALLLATKERLIMGCEESRVGQAGMVQGAYQAILSIQKKVRCNEIKVLDEKYLIWPFHEAGSKSYRMKIQTIKPSNKVW